MDPGARPTRIGRYQVLSVIGRGAMGVVYQAKDPIIDRIIAVKHFSSTDQVPEDRRKEYYDRFFAEAKAVGGLNHPNIVTLHDVGEAGGAPFMAMEWMEGGSLGELMKERGPLPTWRCLSIIRQVALGLGHAHAHGIIHRDVKPANILLDREGRVVVSDFGVARLAESEITRSGEVLGTPNYMSPEQILCEPLDGRSDLFSLGVVFYLMISGHQPFKGETITTICYHIVHSPPEPLPPVLSVPGEVAGVIERTIAKVRNERYASAEDLVKALDALAVLYPPPEEEPTTRVLQPPPSPPGAPEVEAPPPPAALPPSQEAREGKKARKTMGKGLIAALAAGGVVLSLLVLAGLLWGVVHLWKRQPAPPPPAPGEVSGEVASPAPPLAGGEEGVPASPEPRENTATRPSPKPPTRFSKGRQPSRSTYPKPDPAVLRALASAEAAGRDAEAAAAALDFPQAFGKLEEAKARYGEARAKAGTADRHRAEKARKKIEASEATVRKQFEGWAFSLLAKAEKTFTIATDRINDDEAGIIRSYARVYPLLALRDRLPDELVARLDKLKADCRDNLNDDEWATAQRVAKGEIPPPQE